MTDAMKREAPAGLPRAEWAYRQIKQRILDNEFPPGFQALEQELAARLGVSRTPVREALVRLANEGLVEVLPRRGMRVVPLSPTDMKEIYEVLTCLETMAAELLARRGLPAEQLDPMADALDAMDRALEADNLEAWATADERYHRLLIELCGNRRLATMAGTVRDQVHRARLISLRLREKPWQSNVEHRSVLDAIRRGDAAAARQTHRRHRARTNRQLAEILGKYRLPQL